MSTYSNREYTDMILSLGACGGNASAAADHYRHRHPNRRFTVRSVITRRDKVHAYRAKIQSRFSRKQSLKGKIFILHFRLLFSRRITPVPLVPPVTNHPVYTSNDLLIYCSSSRYLLIITNTKLCRKPQK